MLIHMKTIRNIHLALGCLFAPLLLLFAASGIWQRVPSSFTGQLPSWLVNTLALLGTVHTGKALKLGQTLSSGWMTALVVAMAMSLVLTIVFGVVLAFRFGHRKVALGCLLLGVLIPASVCVMTYEPGDGRETLRRAESAAEETRSEFSKAPAVGSRE